MNGSIIRYILGYILKIEGLLMLLPCIIVLIYKEKEGFCFLGVALCIIVLGMISGRFKPKDHVFYVKEGCVATALSWILMSFCGGIPFILTGEISSFTDAMFETVSGFTTTGASILTDVEALAHCSLFWRSFTHWIGGMGVLVFLLTVIPLTGGSHMNLMKAESPGPSVEKLVPKVRHTARILYSIYIGMTFLQIVLLLIGNMPAFDAVTISFGTAGTGGFGIKNDSLAGYSSYIQWVTAIFMILFGINFNAYYLVLCKQLKKAISIEEVRGYIIIILAAIGIIFFQIVDHSAGVLTALRDATFQVGSIITTTGYATVDFDEWSQVAKTVLVMLMFIGACAGSTGGGIKVSRIMLLIKTIFKELNSYIHPKSVKKITMEGKSVEHEVVRSINVYLIAFIMLFVCSVLLVSFDGKSFTTNFTAVAATINNIGPGLEMVGPTQNFSHFSNFSKWVFIFDMLAGRLELFPLLILFYPPMWKNAVVTAYRKYKN